MITLHKPTHRSDRPADSASLAAPGYVVSAPARAAAHCWTTGRANTPAHVCTSSFCAKHSSTGVL